MTSIPRIDVIVPAAGVGKRMKLSIPKQYTKILDKTVLEHTIEALFKCEYVANIIVGVSKDDPYFDELEISKNKRVIKAIGGKERSDTVMNCLKDVTTPWVMVHDAARPLIEKQDLDNLATIINEDVDGAILASPVADTLKKVDDTIIEKTVSRSSMWRAFTPQLIKTKLLEQALTHAYQNNISITDDASAVELLNGKVKVVEGSALNFKLTTQDDLKLATLIIKDRMI